MRTELDEGELLRMHQMRRTSAVLKAKARAAKDAERVERVAVNWKGKERLIHGYAAVWCPSHFHANAQGYVRCSVLMWEAYHGRRFPKGRVPHHINADKTNDDYRNILSLLPSEHALLEDWIWREKNRFTKERAE